MLLYWLPPPMWFGDDLLNNFAILSRKIPFWRNLGWSVYVALASTALTLLLLPLIYEWSESRVEAKRLAAERAEVDHRVPAGDECVTVPVRDVGGPKMQATLAAIVQRQLDLTLPGSYESRLLDVGTPAVRVVKVAATLPSLRATTFNSPG